MGRVGRWGRVRAGVPLTAVAGLMLALPDPAMAESVPSPWVNVHSYAAGVQLPLSTVCASWSEKKPGCVADLSISGVEATGTSTLLTAEWTSRPMPLRRFHFSSSWSFERNMVIETLPDDVRMTVRVRLVGGRWSPWFASAPALRPPTSAYLDQYGTYGFGGVRLPVSTGPDRLVQIEWRLQERLTSTSTVLDKAEVKLAC
jgi:hypothetical protein